MRKIKIHLKNLDRIDNGMVELKSDLHVAAKVRFQQGNIDIDASRQQGLRQTLLVRRQQEEAERRGTEAAHLAKEKLNNFLYGDIKDEIQNIMNGNGFDTQEMLWRLRNQIEEILEYE